MSLESRIPQIIRELEKAEAVNQASARKIASDASAGAPRESGELADGIEAMAGEGDDWGVAIRAWYWFLVENGTVKTGARPFLTPAVEAERDNHARAIRKLFES